MTEREKFNIAETKHRIFNRDKYICQNCGKSIVSQNNPNLAHGIHQSKANLKKYGPEIVHSDYNLKSACCGFCNDALNVGFTQEEKRAEEIREMIENE